jgi:hypothetical protein
MKPRDTDMKPSLKPSTDTVDTGPYRGPDIGIRGADRPAETVPIDTLLDAWLNAPLPLSKRGASR